MASPEVEPSAVANNWEEVLCFRCDNPGETLYRVGACAVKQCGDCSQVFTSPKPTEESLRKLYDKDYEYGLFRLPGWRFQPIKALQMAWTKARLDLIEEAVDVPARSSGFEVVDFGDRLARTPKLLEIGVPLGMLFLYKTGDRGFYINGHQYSPVVARLIGEAWGAPIYDGPLEKAGLKDDKYDAVCAWDVIEHVPDPSIFLDTIKRTAKPGATIAISCPNFDSIPQRLLHDKWWTLKPGEHIWHFTPETISQVLDDAGLPVNRIIQSPLHPANLGRLDSMVVLANNS